VKISAWNATRFAAIMGLKGVGGLWVTEAPQKRNFSVLCTGKGSGRERGKPGRSAKRPITHLSSRISTYQACHFSRSILNNVLSIARVLLNAALNSGVLRNGTHSRVANP
jgi:hypothetical protein